MTNENNNLNPDQQLSAFADNELDEAQSRLVQQRLQADPSLAQRVESERKLRQACSKVMTGPAYQAPTALHDKIADLAQTVPCDEADQPASAPAEAYTGPPVLARIGKWIPAAVAAVLMIGTLIVINNNSDKASNTAWIDSSGVLNASLVQRFGGRHIQCSRNNAPLKGADKFPQNLTELPGALSEYLNTTVSPVALDFSGLGYQFDVAGLCILPGEGSVHIIYQSQSPDADGNTGTLSLWLRPYPDGTAKGPADMPELEPDKLYASKATDDAQPMIIWRHADIAYYLVGDDYDTVEQAFAALRQVP